MRASEFHRPAGPWSVSFISILFSAQQLYHPAAYEPQISHSIRTASPLFSVSAKVITAHLLSAVGAVSHRHAVFGPIAHMGVFRTTHDDHITELQFAAWSIPVFTVPTHCSSPIPSSLRSWGSSDFPRQTQFVCPQEQDCCSTLLLLYTQNRLLL